MPPINRRDLLKVVSGAATITGLTSIVGGSEDTVEMVTVRDGDKIVRTATVPKSWYRRVEHTRNVHHKAVNDHIEKRGVLRISRTAGDQRFGGKRAPVFRIVYDPEEYKGDVPDEIDGVPVRKEAGERMERTCANRDDFDPIPGGVHLNSNGSAFTSFATAEKEDNEYLLTASHPWDACEGSTQGESVEQHYNQYGEVDASHPYLNVARTEVTDSSYSLDSGVIQTEDQTYTIAGVATEDGVDNYMSTDTTIRKIGISTGDTTGEVDDMNVSRYTCPSFNSDGVRLTNNQAGGDSGGPAFRGYSSGNCTLVNINTYGYDKFSTVCNNPEYRYDAGTAAYKIEDYGYSFT